MSAVCVINFNARIHDPTLARFLSADPMVGSIFDLQQFNRYSYVTNNPLSLTDPSGMCFLGCFWHNVFKALKGPLEFAVAAFNGAVSRFTAGGVTAGVSGGSWDSVLLNTVQGAANGALGTWQTTSWQPLRNPGQVGLADVAAAKTDWPAVLLKSSIEAGLSVLAANGRNSGFAAVTGFTTTLADETYQAYVPQQPDFIGDGDGGAPKMGDTQVVLGKNNFGTLRNPLAMSTQSEVAEGGDFSAIMDGDVPGMRAFSYLHDVWSGEYADSLCLRMNTCGTLMVPAAMVVYPALFRNLPLNALGSDCDWRRKQC